MHQNAYQPIRPKCKYEKEKKKKTYTIIKIKRKCFSFINLLKMFSILHEKSFSIKERAK